MGTPKATASAKPDGDKGGTDLSIATKKLGVTVKQYVLERLSDDLQVIQDPERKQLVGALPVSVDVESEGGVEELLERTQRSKTSTIPRYDAAFWAAFRIPLEDHKRRYVTDQHPILFRDIDPTIGKSFGREIGRDYILASDAEPSHVAKRIEDWFDDNEVDSKIYERTSRPSTRQPSEPRNLLDCVLESLDPDELKRVTMPLDVILRLRRQSP